MRRTKRHIGWLLAAIVMTGVPGATADAGYEEAIACAREHGLRLPGILG